MTEAEWRRYMKRREQGFDPLAEHPSWHRSRWRRVLAWPRYVWRMWRWKWRRQRWV